MGTTQNGQSQVMKKCNCTFCQFSDEMERRIALAGGKRKVEIRECHCSVCDGINERE